MKKIISKMNPLLFVSLLMVAFTSQALAKNPGKSASSCVNVVGTTITNNCSQNVFVIWCGDLKYSSKRCGDGPNGGFYTHSDNFKPGQSKTLEVKPGKTYRYASCFGKISFGNNGMYTDSPNGSYRCLPN
ncbi:MAG: hypothetical protein JW802_05355 [Campylobacterales bacterium]|nr:hypothetical protein [Campylobacterales bacterium]